MVCNVAHEILENKTMSFHEPVLVSPCICFQVEQNLEAKKMILHQEYWPVRLPNYFEGQKIIPKIFLS